MALVYADIAISWQLLSLTVLKNIFLRFIGLKGLKMVWKKVPWFQIFFPDFGWKTLFFPDWKKSSKFSLNSLIGGNPDWSRFLPPLAKKVGNPGEGVGMSSGVVCLEGGVGVGMSGGGVGVGMSKGVGWVYRGGVDTP